MNNIPKSKEINLLFAKSKKFLRTKCFLLLLNYSIKKIRRCDNIIKMIRKENF